MYVCNECLEQFKKWYGQCPMCKAWNTITKTIETTVNIPKGKIQEIVNLNSIQIDLQSRFKSGIEQLDLVLGGGFVDGSLTLIGGRPGVGKSTLILKLAENVSQTRKVLYVSGEESLMQIKLRAERLAIKDNIMFLNAQNTHDINATSLKNKIDFLIIDSIQTTVSPNNASMSGSVSQLKTIALEMMNFAKNNNVTVVLIGHVTKDGDIAGPKLLEHMVDTVLYLEKEKINDVRIIRSEKNRFGKTTEIGMLKLDENGFRNYDVNSFIQLKNISKQDGVAMSAIRIGGRNMFVEIQSLITNTAYPSPKRSCYGIEISKLNILLAIIQKHFNLSLSYDDVYLKLRGNIKENNNAIDLGIVMSLYSAKQEIPIANNDLFLGEVTLTGNVLSVQSEEELIKAAIKLGYKRIFCNSALNNKHIVKIQNIHDVTKEIRG